MKSEAQEIQELKEFWNKRFAGTEYVYGKEPNAFFKSVIDGLKPGRMFIPGAGEGRDAIYAASKGWEVHCADVSEAAKDNAIKLAAERNVTISYYIMDINNVAFQTSYFDVIASVFFHLPGDTRRRFYQNVINWLKPGGLFIMQAFTPQQLQYTSGGPKDLDMLINTVQTAEELTGLDIVELKESETFLDEGTHHRGMASVLTMVGKKK